ncbi:MAG: rod shape-determining protein MreD [Bacteroidales bacterium]|jgi:rod shape-determining protein MreD|nr:rod shape-determining protein MreD [Bacteroidales bacterium]
MIGDVFANIFRFALLVFLQFFLLNNIQFSGFVNPYLYVLFVLWLPFATPGWLLLTASFIMGLVIDLASETVGYHTVATVFTGYLRIRLLKFIAPHDGYDPNMSPTIPSLGLSWFLKYVVILVPAHHLVLFCVETFSFSDFLPAVLRALASSIFTILFIFIYQFLSIRTK